MITKSCLIISTLTLLSFSSKAQVKDGLYLQYQRDSALMFSDMSVLFQDSSAVTIHLSGSADFPIRISSVKKSARLAIGGSNTLVYYQGELAKSIAHLLNTNMLYVRIKGKIPNEYIYYYGAKTFMDTSNIREKVLKILQSKYKFKVSDIQDSCNVWKIQKVDSTKLIYYDPQLHDNTFGAGLMDDNPKMYFSFGFPLSFVCQEVERRTQIITVADSWDDNWNNRYDFDNIPFALMSDLEGLNALLEKRYGIKFIKNRVLQNLKLIEFEE